jgi:hypothetical protein
MFSVPIGPPHRPRTTSMDAPTVAEAPAVSPPLREAAAAHPDHSAELGSAWVGNIVHARGSGRKFKNFEPHFNAISLHKESEHKSQTMNLHENDFHIAKSLKTMQENTDPQNLIPSTKQMVANQDPSNLGALTIAQVLISDPPAALRMPLTLLAGASQRHDRCGSLF